MEYPAPDGTRRFFEQILPTTQPDPTITLRIFLDFEDTVDNQYNNLPLNASIPEIGDQVGINDEELGERGFFSGQVMRRHFGYLPDGSPMIDLLVYPIKADSWMG